MTGSLLLLIQGLVYFCVMTALLGFRRWIGIGVFVCAVGVMHFLETYLAAVFFIELPFGLLSPGSTVMFSGKLAMILLLYIIEDSEAVRQPIYGLLIGNALMVALVLMLRFYELAPSLPTTAPDLMLIDHVGVLMVWGTTLLFIDSIGIVLIYDALARRWSGHVFLPILVSLTTVLTFDQIAFFFGLHLVVGTPASALIGGWVAKMGAALAFALMTAAYLRWVERPPVGQEEAGTARLFSKLTYRHRYEALLNANRTDPMTGALNRHEFETAGPARLARAAAEGGSLSLALVDIDHFQKVNDAQGRQAGDRLLKRVAEAIQAASRPKDEVFRYGDDEFIVLSLGLSEAELPRHVARIRQAVASSGGPALGLTATVGVAHYPTDAVGFDALLLRADLRLHEAKQAGR